MTPTTAAKLAALLDEDETAEWFVTHYMDALEAPHGGLHTVVAEVRAEAGKWSPS